MVREYGFIATDQNRDKFEYKKIYNDALVQVVDQRTVRIKNGELDAGDFTLKGVVSFLKKLKKTGVSLYIPCLKLVARIRGRDEILGRIRSSCPIP